MTPRLPRARVSRRFLRIVDTFRKEFGVDVLDFICTPPETKLMQILSLKPSSSYRELAIVMGLQASSTLWIRKMLDNLEERKLVSRARAEDGSYAARGARVTSLGLSVLRARGMR